jgi:hypothetical protein
VGYGNLAASQVSGIQRLSQLKHLQLDGGVTTTDSTKDWTCLTALEHLDLRNCILQPDLVLCFGQLRVLLLVLTDHSQGATSTDLLAAVSQLTQLTALLHYDGAGNTGAPPPPAAAFTAFTAITSLCSLQLGLHRSDTPQDYVLFMPGVVHPHLRVVDLQYEVDVGTPPVSGEQLQHMCSCCPALESASLKCEDPSPTTLLPLLQLSALTHLNVLLVSSLPEAAECAPPAFAAAVSTAAQLSSLKQLTLTGLHPSTLPAELPNSTLMPLTVLTALEKLNLEIKRNNLPGGGESKELRLHSKVCRHDASSICSRAHSDWHPPVSDGGASDQVASLAAGFDTGSAFEAAADNR